MEHQKIERINELTRISRVRELTHEEKIEREALRKEYLDGFRENMKAILDNTYIQRPDGSKEALRQRKP